MERITEHEAEEAAARRVGSGHEEMPSGGNSKCGICGWIEDADVSDEVVRTYHADSFLESEDPQPA
jgi:hypothetical protein